MTRSTPVRSPSPNETGDHQKKDRYDSENSGSDNYVYLEELTAKLDRQSRLIDVDHPLG
jgi:hypothetical protein